MAAILERDMGTARPPRVDSGGRARRASTAVVIDESAETDIDSLLFALDGVSETLTILVTRHPQPQCVIGVGSGMEAAVMWNDCVTHHEAEVAMTNERVRQLSSALVGSGAGAVEKVDCYPAFRLFRRQSRREIDAVVRTIEALRPDRIVIDEAHHLCAELRAQIAGLTEATAPH